MYVAVHNLNKNYGDFKASHNVSFQIEKGKMVALLGPSGSGKTTILRMIAGLEIPDTGDIYINGKRVNDIPAGKREIGFLFQNYALFRHMTIYENIAFGLSVQKVNAKEIDKRVKELIALIGLEGLENRYPHQLSGGQRQRVAFARALAPRPQLLLLDEPFAAIDAKVRKELRTWLKEMVKKLNITSIFVTHDQDEAVEVADTIIVTNKGQIEQIGSPLVIYKSPKTSFVAQFIGESTVLSNYERLKGFGQVKAGMETVIRPEFVEITKLDEPIISESAAEIGTVKAIIFRGSNLEVQVIIGDLEVIGYRSLEKTPIRIGEQVHALIHRLYLLDGEKTSVVENEYKQDRMPVYI